MVLNELDWSALDAANEHRRPLRIDPAHPQHRLCDERDFSETADRIEVSRDSRGAFKQIVYL